MVIVEYTTIAPSQETSRFCTWGIHIRYQAPPTYHLITTLSTIHLLTVLCYKKNTQSIKELYFFHCSSLYHDHSEADSLFIEQKLFSGFYYSFSSLVYFLIILIKKNHNKCDKIPTNTYNYGSHINNH